MARGGGGRRSRSLGHIYSKDFRYFLSLMTVLWREVGDRSTGWKKSFKYICVSKISKVFLLKINASHDT